MKATRRQLQWRYARRRFWRKRKAEFEALGLTTRGTRRIYQLHPELQVRRRDEKWRRKIRQRVNRAKNFTAVCHQTPMERLYRQFREPLLPPLNVEDISFGRVAKAI